MKKEVKTENAPQPIGPYSQAIFIDGFLFLSGMLPIKGETIEKKDIKSATELVFKNIEAILNEAGMGFSDVVKVTVFIKNIKDFNDFNEVYSSFFKKPYPAREVVGVKELPKDSPVEVSLIAKKQI